MRKRELFLGFGAGLIVAAGIAGWHQGTQAPSAMEAFSSEQIKKAAEELKMVVLSKEEYDQWQQEKKVNVKPAPKAPQAPAAPETEKTVEPQSPNSPQPGVQSQAAVPTVQQASASTAQAAVETAPNQAKEPVKPVVPAPKPERQVTFTVPYKATAEGVAKQLAALGVLPADNTLVEELRRQNKLNRIRVGTYQITAPASAADIVKLITTPPQR